MTNMELCLHPPVVLTPPQLAPALDTQYYHQMAVMTKQCTHPPPPPSSRGIFCPPQTSQAQTDV